MYDPHDDTDVPSGTTDGAQMERTPPPVSRRDRPGIPGIQGIRANSGYPPRVSTPAGIPGTPDTPGSPGTPGTPGI